ncbi:Gx transporter family protein [Enterococcus hirae]|nr:Gx transporter family protein [Enterococcus hirae]
MMKTPLKQVLFIALLTAQAVVLGIIEQLIPFPFAFAPGAKLGLPNLITLIALFTMKKRESFLLVWMRVILTTLLGGTASTFLYSITGALLSYFGMLLVKQLGAKRISLVGISAVGGFLHNVGQLLMASLIAETTTVMYYLPFMSLIGLIAGIALGIAANYLFRHVRELQKHLRTDDPNALALRKELNL